MGDDDAMRRVSGALGAFLWAMCGCGGGDRSEIPTIGTTSAKVEEAPGGNVSLKPVPKGWSGSLPAIDEC